MITAKCNKCGGTALGNTFEEASQKINHAVGLSRGIKCGANYNMVYQIEDSTPKKQIKEPTPMEKPKEPTPTEPKESPLDEKPKSKSKK